MVDVHTAAPVATISRTERRNRERQQRISARRSSAPAVLARVLVVVGCVLRVRQFVFHRSLWTDETMLALNVLHRNYAGLTHPLALLQGAPIGFLWLQKTSTIVFGSNEYALRLVPLLAGLASIFFFASFVRRTLGGWPRCVALAIFAISPTLVYYATEAKQYGMDVFVVVVLCWFCGRLLDSELSWSNVLVWAGVTAVLIWCSFPAPLAAGATTGVLVISAWRGRRWNDIKMVAIGTAIWLASLGLEYLVSLRKLHGVKALLGYWQGGMAPQPLRVGTTVSWLGSTVHGLVGSPLDFGVWPLAVALIGVGLLALLWRRFYIGVFIVVVIGGAFAAAIVHEYPVQGRLVVFFVPLACVALAATLLLSRRWPAQLLVCALIAAVMVPSVASAAHAVWSPYTTTEAREAYLYVQQHERPGDKILVEWSGMAVYYYYNETLGVSGTGSFQVSDSVKACDNGAPLGQLRAFSRIWFVFAVPPGIEANAISQYMPMLRQVGRVLTVHLTPGNAGAVLVQVRHRAEPANPPLPAPNWGPGAYGCAQVTLFGPASG
ncbi:MAG TPA: glycosyltransferase family 39 protein [Acidimicrobiales bacterium]|nr:glycosyltransferase family 39 protein [Acidimicrobiales bacterium]